MKDRGPMFIGGAIGLALSGYVFVYAPMKRNYDECGKVTLCHASATEAGTAKTVEQGLAEGESAAPEGGDAQ